MKALPRDVKDVQAARIVYLPNEGKSVSARGIFLTFKAVSADTGGAWALLEYTMPPYFRGPDAHWHKRTLEGFYILSGTVTIQLETDSIKAPAGSFILVPPGTIHKFSNEEAVPATFLVFVSPGGLEQYFEELATLLQEEQTWPPTDMSNFEALSLKYDQYPPSAARSLPAS
jgi:mannose-6-phosphate isomerase-like protein (cupin superfamily)